MAKWACSANNENKCVRESVFFSLFFVLSVCGACHLRGFYWTQTFIESIGFCSFFLFFCDLEVRSDSFSENPLLVDCAHKQSVADWSLFTGCGILSDSSWTSHKHTATDNEGRLKVATGIYRARGSWQEWLYTYQVVRIICCNSWPQFLQWSECSVAYVIEVTPEQSKNNGGNGENELKDIKT